MNDYRRIADRIAADIANGRLRAGQQLPPQRAFARRHGLAPSTAGRVYAELVRRGLVVGEVGRGTFVRAAAPDGQPGRTLTEAAGDELLTFDVLPVALIAVLADIAVGNDLVALGQSFVALLSLDPPM